MIQGVRPTTFLLRKQPHSKWNELDFLLAEAYQVRLDELTEQGVPSYLAYSHDPTVMFAVEATQNRAAAEIESWDEAQGKKDEKPKGMARVAVPKTLDDQGQIVDIEVTGLSREMFIQRSYEVQVEEEEQRVAAGIDIELVRPAGGYDPREYGDGIG